MSAGDEATSTGIGVDPRSLVNATLRDAREWARLDDRRQEALTSRDVLAWAVENDPVRWRKITERLGGVHFALTTLNETEDISPHANFSLTLSAPVARSAALATELAERYHLAVDPSLLAFACMFADGSYVNSWVREKLSTFDAAAEASEILFGGPLSELGDVADLLGEPLGQGIELSNRQMKQRFRRSPTAFVLALLFLHIAFGQPWLQAGFFAYGGTYVLPGAMSHFATERLRPLQIISLAAVGGAIVLSATTFPLAAAELRSSSTTERAERTYANGDYLDAYRTLSAMSNDAKLRPRVRVLIACSLDRLGFHDGALAQLQVAYFAGYRTRRDVSLGQCVVNRINTLTGPTTFSTGVIEYLEPPAGDPEWTARAREAISEHDLATGLIDLACAHHLAGNLDTASLLLMDALTRLSLAPGNDLVAAVSDALGVDSEDARCVRLVADSGLYESRRDAARFFVRPKDFKERLP